MAAPQRFLKEKRTKIKKRLQVRGSGVDEREERRLDLEFERREKRAQERQRKIRRPAPGPLRILAAPAPLRILPPPRAPRAPRRPRVRVRRKRTPAIVKGKRAIRPARNVRVVRGLRKKLIDHPNRGRIRRFSREALQQLSRVPTEQGARDRLIGLSLEMANRSVIKNIGRGGRGNPRLKRRRITLLLRDVVGAGACVGL